MSRKISDDTRISKNFSVADWKALSKQLHKDLKQPISNSDLWKKAYRVFWERTHSRFLAPADLIIKQGRSEGEGFAVVAIQCILIEYLEAWYQGKIYVSTSPCNELKRHEYNSSEPLFVKFLTTQKPFCAQFNRRAQALSFYHKIRCGVIHEGRTKEDTKIRDKKGNLLIERSGSHLLVYRTRFQDALKQFLEDYEKELLKKRALKENFLRKMDNLCGIK